MKGRKHLSITTISSQHFRPTNCRCNSCRGYLDFFHESICPFQPHYHNTFAPRIVGAIRVKAILISSTKAFVHHNHTITTLSPRIPERSRRVLNKKNRHWISAGPSVMFMSYIRILSQLHRWYISQKRNP